MKKKRKKVQPLRFFLTFSIVMHIIMICSFHFIFFIVQFSFCTQVIELVIQQIFIACIPNILTGLFWIHFQYLDSEKGRSSSRYGSTSRKAISSGKQGSGEHSEGRTGRIVSSSGRPSTTQRIQPGYESKPSYTRTPAAARGTRDDPLRSFELLSIRK